MPRPLSLIKSKSLGKEPRQQYFFRLLNGLQCAVRFVNHCAKNLAQCSLPIDDIYIVT